MRSFVTEIPVLGAQMRGSSRCPGPSAGALPMITSDEIEAVHETVAQRPSWSARDVDAARPTSRTRRRRVHGAASGEERATSLLGRIGAAFAAAAMLSG